MDAILGFLQFVTQALLSVCVWIVIVYVILSWLINFDIINLRNRAVYQISRSLDSVARILLWPFRRVIPAIGGIDFSPLLFIIVVGGVQAYIVPGLFGWLRGMTEGGA